MTHMFMFMSQAVLIGHGFRTHLDTIPTHAHPKPMGMGMGMDTQRRALVRSGPHQQVGPPPTRPSIHRSP